MRWDCGPLRGPCQGGGDRTKRHNRLRGIVPAQAAASGLSAEVEKQGLLPDRPDELGFCESGRPSASQRRPADVYNPSWGAHGPAAFDLAATSGMRGAVLPASAANGGAAAAAYEVRNRAHHNKAPRKCPCRVSTLTFFGQQH